MSGDALSDLLRAVRLRGAVFFYLKNSGPWVAETPQSSKIIPAVMPGVDHLIPFHGVASGSCWAGIVEQEPIRLTAGDVVLFPQGDHHVISSAPGLRAKSVDTDLYFSPRPPQLPWSLKVADDGTVQTASDDDDPEQTTIVCGYVGSDAKPFNPLIASMPKVLHRPATQGSWIVTFLRSLAEESNRKRPGGEALLERMSEMLFVEVLRRHAESMPPEQTGWLAGMRDPAIGRALAVMHERPSDPWTLERLAEAAAISRSVLHERFVHLIGQPPMQYLSQWRMQLATAWLRDTDAKVIDIAGEVGYESEAAFARAFRRAVGESPGAWRRERRDRAGARGAERRESPMDGVARSEEPAL
jgi:AraC-like DNA-binding protein